MALNPTVAVGDTVQLLLGGSPLAHPVTHTITAADITAGSVSLAVTAGDLGADGGKSISAQFSDAAGNTSTTAALTITLDTTAPAVAITSGGGPVNQAAQTISGTGEAGTTITLSDNGSQLQLPTITVDQNGLWSASVTLANGSNSLTASDTDVAGDAASSSAVIYTLSTTGPTVTESLTIDSGTSSSDRITSSDALSGTGLANTVVHFTIDGSPIATTVTADAQGTWSFTPAGLADGPHTIVASQTDGFGNTGTASLSFTLDTTAPAVAITTIEGGDNIINAAEAAGGIQISGTAETGSSLTVNGAAVTVDGTGHWTTSVTPAGQGALTVTAVATDVAGNSSTASTTLTVDTIAPTGGTPDLVASSDSGVSSTDNITDVTAPGFTVALNPTVAAGDTVQLLLGGSPLAHPVTHSITAADILAGSVSLAVTAGDLGADGGKSISAQFSDAAGNTSTTAALTITLDTIAPTGGTPDLVASSDSGVSSTDNITDVTAPGFTVALNPTVAAGDTVQLLLGGSPLAHPVTHSITAADILAGSVSLAVTAGDLGADGGKSISAQFSDAAGNTSTTAALTITLDTTAPAVAITSGGGPVNQAAQTISGTGEAGTTITLSDNGSQLQLPTITVDQNGLWSASVTLANGSNSLTASDTDVAGNAASSSAVIYTLSTTGPTVTESLTIDSGTSSSDRITSSDALSGTGLANTVVHFTIDGSPIATTVTADAQGTWSFTPAGLADGPHTIVASQTDGFGNTGTASLSFTLDTTAPAVAITTIEGGDNIINAAEAAGGIQITVPRRPAPR